MNIKTNVKGLQLLLLNLTKGKDKPIKEQEKKPKGFKESR